jgi:hypothetical protein
MYEVECNTKRKWLWWPTGSVMAFGTPSFAGVQTRPEEVGIIQSERKNPQHTFGGGIKAVLSHVADLLHVKEP